MRPTASRIVSLSGSPPSHLAPPAALAHRHSIDMGAMPGMVANHLYAASDSGLGLYNHDGEGLSAASSFPTLTTIPHSPINITHGVSTYTPAPVDVDRSYFSNPFAGSYHSPAPGHSVHPGLQTPFEPARGYHEASYFSSPPNPTSQSATPHQSHPQVYVSQPWTPHGRGVTSELMEMYTVAQDYVPGDRHAPAQGQCWSQGEWTSQHPGMATR